MPSCAVATCKSSYNRKVSAQGSPVSFHSFPRGDIANVRLAACLRKDPVNLKAAMICSEHFTSDDFGRSRFSYQIGSGPRRLLNPNAVPTLNLPGCKKLQGADKRRTKLFDERQQRLINRTKKTVINNPVKDHVGDNHTMVDEPEVIQKPVTDKTKNIIIKIKRVDKNSPISKRGKNSVDVEKGTCFVCSSASSSTSKLVQAEEVARFVIRTVLRIRPDSIKDDLLTLGELRNWWSPCSSCQSLIVQCFQLHCQLIEVQRKLQTGQEELVRKYQIHQRNKTIVTSQDAVGTEVSDKGEENLPVKSEVESEDEDQLADDNDPLLVDEDNVQTSGTHSPGTVLAESVTGPESELTSVTKSEPDPGDEAPPPVVMAQPRTSFADIIAKVPEIHERKYPKAPHVTTATPTDPPVLPANLKLIRDPVTHRYNCPLCPFTNVRRCSVALHYEGIHFGFKCTEANCTKSFRRIENYKSHLDKHRGTPRFSCKQCGLKIYYFNKVHSHRQRVHEGGLEKRHFVCDLCGKGFPSGDNLTSHKIISHGDKRPRGPPKRKKQVKLGKFKCDHCPSRFHDKIDFSYHLFYRHKQGTEQAKKDYRDKYKFKCDVKGCTLKCSKQKILDNHVMRFHGMDKDKPPEHLCRHCGRGFFLRGKMVQHELVHENKESRPFKCHLCGNGFPIWGYLQYHFKHVHKLDRETIQAMAPLPRSRSTADEIPEQFSVATSE